MNTELTHAHDMLTAACVPEDVFGALQGDMAEKHRVGKSLYRQLAFVVHEDRHLDEHKAQAKVAFGLLTSWWERAQRKIADGTYGDRTPRVEATIKTRRYVYEDMSLLAAGDISDVYRVSARKGSSSKSTLLKVVRFLQDADLLKNEVAMLREIRKDKQGKKLHRCFPKVLEAFSIKETGGVHRAAASYAYYEGLTSLEDIIRAYPQGVDPRDAVWMWKRSLAILGYAHALGIVHGAVLPSHILIDTENHGAHLCDWGYAIHHDKKEAIKAISTPYESLYPPEVFEKIPASPATDIYMLARCMIRLMGGRMSNGVMPKSIPRQMRNLLRACVVPAQSQRLGDAWLLHKEIDDRLEEMFGPRRFRKFHVPMTPNDSAMRGR